MTRPSRAPRGRKNRDEPAQVAGPPGPAATGSLTKGTWTVAQGLGGKPLDSVLRELAGVSWNTARAAVRSGKVTLDGELALDPTSPARTGEVLAVDPAAPRPRTREIAELGSTCVVHLDGAVVVVRKPAGMSTVPFGDEAPGDELKTLDAMVREVIAKKTKFRGRAPLGVVHRLDKDTTGLIVFTRTMDAKKHLAQQFREHSVRREYIALVHGYFESERTIRSYILGDRGDGLRGSARVRQREGQLAITHVRPLRYLPGATLVACRLQTGRTHQIRIHLSEAGHMILGEPVYRRDHRGPQITAQRTMLHARELGFVHPITEDEVLFEDGPPDDLRELVNQLAGGGDRDRSPP